MSWLKSTTNMDKETFDYYTDCLCHTFCKFYNDPSFESLAYQMKDDWMDLTEPWWLIWLEHQSHDNLSAQG